MVDFVTLCLFGTEVDAERRWEESDRECQEQFEELILLQT
jgi:hypothetical protein